jgi:hypothetical protein
MTARPAALLALVLLAATALASGASAGPPDRQRATRLLDHLHAASAMRVRLEALVLLEPFAGDPYVLVEVARACRDDESPLVRARAAVILAREGDARYVALLTSGLSNPMRLVATACRHALEQIGERFRAQRGRTSAYSYRVDLSVLRDESATSEDLQPLFLLGMRKALRGIPHAAFTDDGAAGVAVTGGLPPVPLLVDGVLQDATVHRADGKTVYHVKARASASLAPGVPTGPAVEAEATETDEAAGTVDRRVRLEPLIDQVCAKLVASLRPQLD